MFRSLVGLAAVAVSAGLAVSTAAETQDVMTDPAVIKAAQQEGVVVWYSSLPIDAIEQLSDAFTKAYGIKVESNRKGTYGLLQALHQEAMAGQTRADLFHVSELGAFNDLKKEGMLAQYQSPEASHFPDKYKDPEGYFYPMRAYIMGIMWNQDHLPAGVEIRNWQDLLDPKLKGLIVTNDASSGGGALYGYYDWKTELGDDWLKALSQQNVLLTDGFGPVANLIASGERPVGPILSYNYWGFADKGTDNIKAVFPTSGVPLIIAPTGILKDAPHPNAARLFQDYLLSAEVQTLMQDTTGQYSLRDDVAPIKYLPPLKDLNIWSTLDKVAYIGDHQRELQDEFASYFK